MFRTYYNRRKEVKLSILANPSGAGESRVSFTVHTCCWCWCYSCSYSFSFSCYCCWCCFFSLSLSLFSSSCCCCCYPLSFSLSLRKLIQYPSAQEMESEFTPYSSSNALYMVSSILPLSRSNSFSSSSSSFFSPFFRLKRKLECPLNCQISDLWQYFFPLLLTPIQLQKVRNRQDTRTGTRERKKEKSKSIHWSYIYCLSLVFFCV